MRRFLKGGNVRVVRYSQFDHISAQAQLSVPIIGNEGR